jgi:hypothetical protein
MRSKVFTNSISPPSPCWSFRGGDAGMVLGVGSGPAVSADALECCLSKVAKGPKEKKGRKPRDRRQRTLFIIRCCAGVERVWATASAPC